MIIPDPVTDCETVVSQNTTNGIALFFPQTWAVMGPNGFYLLLAGGISYTVGAILFGIGKKMPWMHSVFHIFVVLGSALQFLAIYFYVL